MIRWLRKQLGLERLEAELQAARVEIERLQPTPGTAGAAGSSTVTVGGIAVQLKPLSPGQWYSAMGELPGLLFRYAVAAEKNEVLEDDDLERAYEIAQNWIKACAITPDGGTAVNVECLTVPEAMHAIVVISHMNGLDEGLARIFRERLGTPTPRPDLHTLRN
jgi:hypothetical protein